MYLLFYFSIYKVFDLKNYTMLYSISDKHVQEIKIRLDFLNSCGFRYTHPLVAVHVSVDDMYNHFLSSYLRILLYQCLQLVSISFHFFFMGTYMSIFFFFLEQSWYNAADFY